MPSDPARRELTEALEQLLGPRNTATLMESLPPQPWDELATKRDLERAVTDLRGELRGHMGELRGEMGELRGEMGELRGEMGELRGEMGELRGEMGEFRGEVMELRAEVRSLTPKLLVASLGSSATLMGFVLAAAALMR